jgi:hypothetical protein
MGVQFERRIADLKEQKEELDSTRDELDSTQDALEDAQIEAEISATTMHVLEKNSSRCSTEMRMNTRGLLGEQISDMKMEHVAKYLNMSAVTLSRIRSASLHQTPVL